MKLTKLAALSRSRSADLESNTEDERPGSAELLLDEPVFILTSPRSGSSLLRLLLNAHPRLACPPETNVAQWCTHLWGTWSALDPDCGQEKLTEEAVRHIRSAASAPFSAYLRKHGKSRWCDKSLDTAKYTDQIIQLYPKAKFICLYRHAMDMINSGLEATPWGLDGYGFDQYKGSQNSVSAIAESWIQSTALSLMFEEANPDLCLRVYYERLAADPEGVMNSVFDFLGEPAAPGIARSAFANRSIDKYEIGDHKIHASDQVTAASIGTGIRVPSQLLPIGQLAVMNQFLGRLGYTQVDRSWQMSLTVPTLLPAPESQAGSPERAPEGTFATTDAELRRRISRQVASLPAAVSDWSRVAIAAYPAAAPGTASVWLVDRRSGEIHSELGDIDFAATGADWAVTAGTDTWQAVLGGQENLAKAVRQGYVRFIGKTRQGDGDHGQQADPSVHVSDFRLRAITHLLGLAGGLD